MWGLVFVYNGGGGNVPKGEDAASSAAISLARPTPELFSLMDCFKNARTERLELGIIATYSPFCPRLDFIVEAGIIFSFNVLCRMESRFVLASLVEVTSTLPSFVVLTHLRKRKRTTKSSKE